LTVSARLETTPFAYHVLVLAAALAGCATARTNCPLGTGLARRIYSGGGEAEYCHRPDGVRQGPEVRYYESGAEHVAGEYADGAQSGVWRYRFSNGRNWRAERWDDGALVSKTVDPAVARMSREELEALGPTSSMIIKTASVDPRLGREARATGGGSFVQRFDNGRPRVAGDYDADGLRTGIWRFWTEDGRLAREIEYLAGVREHAAREWHPGGAPAAEGFYVAGEREGRWRWWNAQGQLTGEAAYSAGARVTAPAAPAPK
jgi:antitoxin component YwqK of YwqJK toxin-antitoxin module